MKSRLSNCLSGVVFLRYQRIIVVAMRFVYGSLKDQALWILDWPFVVPVPVRNLVVATIARNPLAVRECRVHQAPEPRCFLRSPIRACDVYPAARSPSYQTIFRVATIVFVTLRSDDNDVNI